MYIESEFMLLEANNEQLARENKKLAKALEEIANSETAYYMIDIAKQALGPDECTCLPDLPDGRSRGHCLVHEAEHKNIYIGGE